MKDTKILKNEGFAVTAEDMEKINLYTRRKLTPDEVYVFSVVLCDNDVDRDYERFTVEALFEMEKLFVGKTGICDHNPKAENQTARIFECRVEAIEGRKTLTGDEYFRLTARAYMPRTKENADMISRIDAGICKEVSVGCCAQRNVCSLCSKERGERACMHIPGEVYDGKLCYRELSMISDAYEWSFVAVPAQREAGVIKALKRSRKEKEDMKDILKSISQGESVTLAVEESKYLAQYIKRLEKKAGIGEQYREELLKEVLRLSAVLQPEISEKTMRNSLESLEVCELKEFLGAYRKKAEKKFALCSLKADKTAAKNSVDNKEFSI